MNVPLPRTTSSTSAGSSGEPAPIQADPTGTFYRFEKTVSKTRGGDGSAGVWKRACNGREDKGKHRDLHQAYAQLLNYAGDLENPPPLNIPVARTSQVCRVGIRADMSSLCPRIPLSTLSPPNPHLAHQNWCSSFLPEARVQAVPPPQRGYIPRTPKWNTSGLIPLQHLDILKLHARWVGVEYE